MAEANATKQTKSTAVSAGPKRGPGFTKLEDLLVCKAFIAASEDPVLGANQTGRSFKATMYKMYLMQTEKQAKYDQMMMAQLSSGTRSTLGKESVGPGLYHPRTSDSVYARFKDKISPNVCKFLGVVDTNVKDSGTDNEDYIEECLEIFKQRVGHEFDYMECF